MCFWAVAAITIVSVVTEVDDSDNAVFDDVAARAINAFGVVTSEAVLSILSPLSLWLPQLVFKPQVACHAPTGLSTAAVVVVVTCKTERESSSNQEPPDEEAFPQLLVCYPETYRQRPDWYRPLSFHRPFILLSNVLFMFVEFAANPYCFCGFVLLLLHFVIGCHCCCCYCF